MTALAGGSFREPDSLRCAFRAVQFRCPLDIRGKRAVSNDMQTCTNRLERQAYDYFQRIDALGGVIPAIEQGFFQREIAASAYRYQKEIDDHSRLVIGVNETDAGTEYELRMRCGLKLPFELRTFDAASPERLPPGCRLLVNWKALFTINYRFGRKIPAILREEQNRGNHHDCGQASAARRAKNRAIDHQG